MNGFLAIGLLGGGIMFILVCITLFGGDSPDIELKKNPCFSEIVKIFVALISAIVTYFLVVLTGTFTIPYMKEFPFLEGFLMFGSIAGFIFAIVIGSVLSNTDDSFVTNKNFNNFIKFCISVILGFVCLFIIFGLGILTALYII